MIKQRFHQWIKNSIKWWAEDKINEHDFILGIQYLIRSGVLNPPSSENQKVEDLEETQAVGLKIPKYVKQNASMVVSRQDYIRRIY